MGEDHSPMMRMIWLGSVGRPAAAFLTHINSASLFGGYGFRGQENHTETMGEESKK